MMNFLRQSAAGETDDNEDLATFEVLSGFLEIRLSLLLKLSGNEWRLIPSRKMKMSIPENY